GAPAVEVVEGNVIEGEHLVEPGERLAQITVLSRQQCLTVEPCCERGAPARPNRSADEPLDQRRRRFAVAICEQRLDIAYVEAPAGRSALARSARRGLPAVEGGAGGIGLAASQLDGAEQPEDATQHPIVAGRCQLSLQCDRLAVSEVEIADVGGGVGEQ